jgi:hypothetical protein
MVEWAVNWKGIGGKGYGVIEVWSRNLPGSTEENHRLSQYTRYSGGDSKRPHLEYESGASELVTPHSVAALIDLNGRNT